MQTAGQGCYFCPSSTAMFPEERRSESSSLARAGKARNRKGLIGVRPASNSCLGIGTLNVLRRPAHVQSEAPAERRMPLPEECVTFQIALIGSDGLVVA